jgi:hypothetical protein
MQMIKESSVYQKRRYEEKKEIIYKEAQYTSFLDSGASIIKKGRITRRTRYVNKY